VLDRLPLLRGVRGRMECAARFPNGAVAYVDYAHTPDALERLLAALRPHTVGRLHVVFGAGGDRDRGKRPLMGQAASSLADVAIVTDDNPRSEDPASIRTAILAACPGALEIGDRAKAIETALNGLAAGDVLVVAGKGHEQGQTVGKIVLPFDDVSVIRRLAGCEETPA
jgi:UDP-N-acetylmuramoyl-L-alanyl-D-glutamate--2,6-diaminopimelate ligase